MDSHVTNDPVFGALTWNSHSGAWDGKVLFTPKHPVFVTYFGPPPGEGRRAELRQYRQVYLYHRQREWEYRLAIADVLVQAAELEPHIEEEIQTRDDVAVVARRLTLYEIELDPVGDTWRFYLERRSGMTIALYLNAEGIGSIEF
jgi:hypothetical protein